MEKIVKFFRDEDGLELSEYAVMGALIVLGLVGAITFLNTQIDGGLRAIGTAVSTATTTAGS